MFEKLKASFGRPAAYLSAEWNRRAPRERRLVAALGGAIVATLFLVAGFFVYTTILDLEERNAASREALAAIASHRDVFLEAKSRMLAQEARIGTEKPQLEADLETAAREVGIQIPETTPQPPQPANKRYVEHSVSISLRSVDLLSLANFLKKIETGRRLIVVKKMQIRRRMSEQDKLDVTLTATAWERVKETAPRPRRPGAPIPAKERS